MNRLATPLLAAALLAAAPAAAKSLKSVPVRLDPTKAYVLIEVGNVEGTKMAGTLVLARYDQEKGGIRGLGRAKRDGVKPDGSPHEPTGAALVKQEGRRLYLIELDPDFWVVEGANGTAFSLGSTGVALSAGTVTDLGVAAVANDYAEGDGPEKLTAGKLAKAALLGPFMGGGIKPKPVPATVSFRMRHPGDFPVPEILRAHVVPASWSAPVKFGNHLGGLVNRIGGRKARTGAAGDATGGAPATR